jgi:hypothetical protein
MYCYFYEDNLHVKMQEHFFRFLIIFNFNNFTSVHALYVFENNVATFAANKYFTKCH